MVECFNCGKATKNPKFCGQKCYLEALKSCKIISGFQKGYTPFNKGLTRESSEIVNNMYVNNPGMSGKKQSNYQKLRASQTHKGKVVTSEQKAKMVHYKDTDPTWYESVCRSNKLMWKDPNYVRAQMRARNCKPNKFELYLKSIIDEIYPDEWEFVGDGKLIIDGKCPDFVHKSKPMLIELFGDYWHRYSEETPRIEFFRKSGYDTLIIWTHDFDRKEEVLVKSKISDFCRKEVM